MRSAGGAGGPRCVPPRLLGAARAGHWRPLTQPVWGACGLRPGLCGGYPRTGWGALSVPHGTPAGRAPHCTTHLTQTLRGSRGRGHPRKGSQWLGTQQGLRVLRGSLAPPTIPMGQAVRSEPCAFPPQPPHGRLQPCHPVPQGTLAPTPQEDPGSHSRGQEPPPRLSLRRSQAGFICAHRGGAPSGHTRCLSHAPEVGQVTRTCVSPQQHSVTPQNWQIPRERPYFRLSREGRLFYSLLTRISARDRAGAGPGTALPSLWPPLVPGPTALPTAAPAACTVCLACYSGSACPGAAALVPWGPWSPRPGLGSGVHGSPRAHCLPAAPPGLPAPQRAGAPRVQTRAEGAGPAAA